MTVSLKHAFTSNVADSGDATLVQPSNWNAEHTLTAAENTILGAVTAGVVGEIACTSAGRAILDDADASEQRTTLGVGTGDSPQFLAVNIGDAEDTTVSRSSAGVIAVEGVDIPTISSTNTLTNKRVTPRVYSAASTTSPWAWNSDSYDQLCFTALANDITINADAGTPTDGQKVIFRFKPNTTGIDLTWTTGTSKSFRAVGITLPTALTNGKTTYVGCVYNSADSRWDAIAAVTEV